VQEARSLEELQMQQIERGRVVAYFAFMQQATQAQAQTKASVYKQLQVTIAQQMEGASDPTAAARLAQVQIEEADQLCAEQLIKLCWASKFEAFKLDAAQRFQALAYSLAAKHRAGRWQSATSCS
jgi:hypothetical protein